MMKKIIIISILLFVGFLFATKPVYAQLSCSVVSGSCSGVTVFKMSSLNNAHAELPNQTNYNYSVCCSGITGLGNSCSEPNSKVVLRLSNPSNAHVETNNIFPPIYNYNVCLSAPATSSLACSYETSCPIGWTCLASVSGDTNAHVGDCTAYATKVCCGPPLSAGNVTGWAWIGADCTETTELNRSDTSCDSNTIAPVGWISFSSNNPEITCDSASYGVNVDYNTGEISGAAFIGVGEDADVNDCDSSENSVGWLDFNDNSVPACGSSGYPSGYCFPAKLVGNEIQGWAPIKSKNQSGNIITITWVRFKGLNYSVKINADGTISANQSEHYAWSGIGREGGFGWIDFRNVKFPASPPVISSTSYSFGFSCHQSRIPQINWDISGVNTPYEIEIKIDDNSSFNTPEIEEIKQVTTNSWMASCFYCCNISPYNKIEFGGKTYYWQIRARNLDSDGQPGVWSSPQIGSFTTLNHCAPFPDFETSVSSLTTVGQIVNFTDKSTCYQNNPDGVPCKDLANTAYFWDFGDGALPATSNVKGDATTTYSNLGEKTVTLQVTDDILTCQETKGNLFKVTYPLPIWKEIPPF